MLILIQTDIVYIRFIEQGNRTSNFTGRRRCTRGISSRAVEGTKRRQYRPIQPLCGRA